MPSVTVKHKFIHQAPRKVRLISDTVRGLPAAKAIAELSTLNQAASLAIRKLILAGVAAAEGQGLDTRQLFIGQIMVGEGPKLKRFNMLSRGRSAPIQKKMSHLTISLTDQPVKIASGRAYRAELHATGAAKPTRSAKKVKSPEPTKSTPTEQPDVTKQSEGSK